MLDSAYLCKKFLGNKTPLCYRAPRAYVEISNAITILTPRRLLLLNKGIHLTLLLRWTNTRGWPWWKISGWRCRYFHRNRTILQKLDKCCSGGANSRFLPY